jgi:hypothetical protein
MDNAARIRQRILALSLPITALLYVSCEALDPKGTDTPIQTMADALQVLPIAARHPGQHALTERESATCAGVTKEPSPSIGKPGRGSS